MQFTAPSKELRIANREKINDAGDVPIRMDSGPEVAFNIREHPLLDHGYAVTSHSSQGQTSERVLIWGAICAEITQRTAIPSQGQQPTQIAM